MSDIEKRSPDDNSIGGGSVSSGHSGPDNHEGHKKHTSSSSSSSQLDQVVQGKRDERGDPSPVPLSPPSQDHQDVVKRRIIFGTSLTANRIRR